MRGVLRTRRERCARTVTGSDSAPSGAHAGHTRDTGHEYRVSLGVQRQRVSPLAILGNQAKGSLLRLPLALSWLVYEPSRVRRATPVWAYAVVSCVTFLT